MEKGKWKILKYAKSEKNTRRRGRKKQKMGENKNVYLFDTFVYAIFMYIYVIFAGAYFSII